MVLPVPPEQTSPPGALIAGSGLIVIATSEEVSNVLAAAQVMTHL